SLIQVYMILTFILVFPFFCRCVEFFEWIDFLFHFLPIFFVVFILSHGFLEIMNILAATTQSNFFSLNLFRFINTFFSLNLFRFMLVLLFFVQLLQHF
ncbi:hypothetical protein ACJX0J_032724, partial [Zea mays]